MMNSWLFFLSVHVFATSLVHAMSEPTDLYSMYSGAQRELKQFSAEEICDDVGECTEFSCKHCRYRVGWSKETPEGERFLHSTLTFLDEGERVKNSKHMPVDMERSVWLGDDEMDCEVVGWVENGQVRICDAQPTVDFQVQRWESREASRKRTQKQTIHTLVAISITWDDGPDGNVTESPCIDNGYTALAAHTQVWDSFVHPWLQAVYPGDQIIWDLDKDRNEDYDVFEVTVRSDFLDSFGKTWCYWNLGDDLAPVVEAKYPGLDLDTYNHRIWFQPGCGGASNGGPIDGTPIFSTNILSQTCDPDDIHINLWMHELGHGLGWCHSGAALATPFGDRTSCYYQYASADNMMGTSWAPGWDKKGISEVNLVRSNSLPSGAVKLDQCAFSRDSTLLGVWEDDLDGAELKIIDLWIGGIRYAVSFRSNTTGTYPDGDVEKMLWLLDQYTTQVFDRVYIRSHAKIRNEENGCPGPRYPTYALGSIHEDCSYLEAVLALGEEFSFPGASFKVVFDSQSDSTHAHVSFYNTTSLDQYIVRSLSNGESNGQESGGILRGVGANGEFVHDNTKTTILLFHGIQVPRGAVVLSAKMRFLASSNVTGATTIPICIEDVGMPEELVPNAPNGASGRVLVNDTVEWIPQQSWTKDHWYETADLSPLITKVFGRNDWECGNALSFILQPTLSNSRSFYPNQYGTKSPGYGWDPQCEYGDCLPQLEIEVATTGLTHPESSVSSATHQLSFFSHSWIKQNTLEKTVKTSSTGTTEQVDSTLSSTTSSQVTTLPSSTSTSPLFSSFTSIGTSSLLSSSLSSLSECEIGSERCDCTAGGACDEGLICLSQLCVRDSTSTESVMSHADSLKKNVQNLLLLICIFIWK